ncbi:MAG: hypothetical protein Q4A30_00330 [Candidatus Saccharibacteria bacterium]|nr:hypothetical protein [Candidatus Saccharibacteria bacterium]
MKIYQIFSLVAFLSVAIIGYKNVAIRVDRKNRKGMIIEKQFKEQLFGFVISIFSITFGILFFMESHLRIHNFLVNNLSVDKKVLWMPFLLIFIIVFISIFFGVALNMTKIFSEHLHTGILYWYIRKKRAERRLKRKLRHEFGLDAIKVDSQPRS